MKSALVRQERKGKNEETMEKVYGCCRAMTGAGHRSGPEMLRVLDTEQEIPGKIRGYFWIN